MSFVNLHAHSHYSLLDGFGSPKDIVLRAKELGYPAAALTDHGVTYGLLEFYQAAKAEGVKPILGCEMYVATRSRFDKEAKIDVKPYHLTVLAKNNTGYENILKLTTKAHLEGFYYKPRVDYDLLKEHGEGLIVLSGCLAAHLPRLILSENEEEIHNLVKKYIDIFGKENYYLEVQDNPLIENQNIVNAKIKELAKEYGLGIVLTFDSHYPRPEDSDAHDVLLCIQTGSTVNEENRMRYQGDFSIRDVEELRAVFKDFPGAIENTVKIAEKCNVEFEFGENLIPSFSTPNNEKPKDYLRTLCEEGLKERFEKKKVPKEYLERLDFELSLVNKMGFDTYFLIVQDFVKFAKDRGILVGPGRGSAAGAIIAWSLKITDVDPIKHELLFERFLNPERISMPDIDIDFADNRRDEVLNYVIEKYGKDNVAQIITFGTMAARAAIRDVGRALGYPYAEVDKLSKTVPAPILGKHAPLIESIKDDPDLKDCYENNERYKVLLDYAKQLEGTVRHVGTHACAVVISENPLTNYTSLQFGARNEGEIVSQYSAGPLETLGLLKMDFLGLKNLTVIDKTIKLVKENHNKVIELDKISMTDKKTFKLLQKADTTGVFQLESGGMKRYLKELKPTEFEDIVAMGALYRPGPMEWIPNYIKGKHNPKTVHYLHDSFKTILKKTHGVAVYQEQILQLARDFAGFSLGEADILRKAVGKKIPTLLNEQREKFVKGAIANKHSGDFAEEVFEKVIEPFAGYGFNRAHAVCYGLIAYQTAYLKAHFPLEFMTALLCNDANNTDRVVLEIKECDEMGIDVLPPSINHSYTNFHISAKNQIRFGLLATKGIGEGPINEIIRVRNESGEFKSIEDFAKRVPTKILNKKTIQALAYSGALDEFGDRNQLAENYELLSQFSKNLEKTISEGQTDIFAAMGSEEEDHAALKLKDVPKSTRMQRLKWEKELLGMYVSGHPLRGLKNYIQKKGRLINSITKKDIGQNLSIMGIANNLRKILTKSGTYMSTFSIEGSTAKINAVMFPKTYLKFGSDLNDEHIFGFVGKVDMRDGQYQFIVNGLKPLSFNNLITNAKKQKLFDENEKLNIAVRSIDDILAEEEEKNATYLIQIPSETDTKKMNSLKQLLLENRGETLVELHLLNANKKIKLPFGVNLTQKLKDSIDNVLV